MAKNRKYDIVLFGATGFTGELTAQYLASQADSNLTWAIAGRNRTRLEQVREELAAINPACAEIDILLADAGDAVALKEVAAAASVIITTVGPYIRYGEALVAACAECGTDYVDLTGEPEFVDRMWLAYQEQAQASGARIVTSCGFDSIPHDLGALFTVQQLPEGVPIEVEGFVRAGGDISGGTWHSAITAFSRLRKTIEAGKQRRARESWPGDRRIGSTQQGIRYSKVLGSWVVPFPGIDPQVVRRSAASDERYGPAFRYGHYIQVKSLPKVAALVGGASLAMLGAQFKFTRRRLLKFRDPGNGPSAETRAKAWFRVRFIGKGGGKQVITEVTGGDPGYGETAKMLAESAMCLAKDRLPKRSGLLTPATAMGDKLIKRLQKAGIGFNVVESN